MMSCFKSSVRPACIAVSALIMCNLNALVDLVLHPGIPYLDSEHLIVGGATLLVLAVLYRANVALSRYLDRAGKRIRSLEAILPICSYCKNIRRPGADPGLHESWSSVESYFQDRTNSRFSHSICPGCESHHFPQDRTAVPAP